MPHSHHSHSGEFCTHASDTLAQVVAKAMERNMQTYALTEHMPRDRIEDLYPGEMESGYDLKRLETMFSDFHAEARRLQNMHASSINLLVGMEIEWIRPETKDLIETLLARYQFDLFVGSVHHVHGLPIDFTKQLYDQAAGLAAQITDRDASLVSKEEMLIADYFDAQFDMLQALQPPVVGHFDLIRLMSSDPNAALDSNPFIWGKIIRNLQAVKNYDGLLEVNSAALRKGLQEPYPKSEIVKEFAALGGKFVLSDDSHGTQQVGAEYRRALLHLENCGVTTLSYLERKASFGDNRSLEIGASDVTLTDLWKHSFWNSA